MSQRFGWGVLVIVVISLFIMFFNLGAIPLLDPDEPVYAETAREMIAFDDFLSPRIYGEYWYDKPPMYYWLVAGAFKVFGVNEFAARFPSALLAVVCVLYVYAAGTRLFNERAGLAGALVLTTSIEFFYLGKAAVTDITLTLFLTVALLAFIEKRYYLLYLATGLATVTKGPVGFLFPGAIILLFLAATRDFAVVRKMKLPSGVLLFAVVALPWYGLMYSIHGNAFVETFIGFHNITRFTSPEHPEVAMWYYFVPVLMLGFLPWTAILAQSVWAALTSGYNHSRQLLFLILWAAFIFLFFTVSETKLVSYILPMYPPLALVTGWYLDRLWDRRNGARVISWPVLSTVLLGAFGAGLIYGVRVMPELATGAIAAAGLFALTIIGTWYFILRRDVDRAFWLQICSMVLFSVILMTLLLPQAAIAFHSRDIAQEFTARYDGTSPVYIIKQLRPGFAYYSGVYGSELEPEGLPRLLAEKQRVFLVVGALEYQEFSEAQRQSLQVLATVHEKMLLLKP
ncbi:MAG TPA: glycosyltransferase family 39 protein [Selenomonadales bacterium]|nr:glycosyltransferase family 39 protein [Selenomonadales bacterium]